MRLVRLCLFVWFAGLSCTPAGKPVTINNSDVYGGAAGMGLPSKTCDRDAQCPYGTICYPLDGSCFTGHRDRRLLEPTASLESCKLGYVFFPENSAEIPAQDQPWLDHDIRCANYLKLANLVLEGHADATGDQQANRALSDRRAEAVRAYLQAHGLSIPITIRAAGATEGKGNERMLAWERRVELLLK